jgi:CRP-like cAMP-binding protein
MENLLRNIYHYPSLKEIDLQKIIAMHHLVHIKKGELILREGQIAKTYGIILNGLIRSYVIDATGNEITTGFFGDTELYIEVASLFKQEPTQEYYQALTDCTLYEINFTEFQSLFINIPAFAEWGRAWMTQALSQQKERMLNMITRSAQERYLQLVQEKPQIIQNAALKYIASYLGITDTSLSRIRKEIIK